MTTVSVANASALLSALRTAQGGDTILLAAGDYGDVDLSRLNFASEVTIRSADAAAPACFTGLDIANARNIRIDSIALRFMPTETTYAWSSAINIRGSSDITIANSVMQGGPSINGVPASATELDATGNVLGMPTGRAASVTGSSNITFTRNDISAFHKAIVLSDVDGITISDSDIHDLRSTPVSGGDVSNLVVSNNHLHDSNPWQFTLGGDHGDFVHIWTSPTLQTSASRNISITNNFIDQGLGQPLLGIYLDDNQNNLGFQNVRITENVIFNDDGQGIRLENAHGVTITDNSLIQSRGTAGEAPAVILADGTDDVTFTRNILSGAPSATLSGAADGNLYLQRIDTNAANYYGRVFVNAMTTGAKRSDLQILPTSTIAGQGYGSNQSVFSSAEGQPVAVFTTLENATNHKQISFDASLSVVETTPPPNSTATCSYSWDFGDGSRAKGLKPVHTYAATGNYAVTLTVKDPFGNISVRKRDLKVIDEYLLHLDFSSTGVAETSTYASPLTGALDSSNLVETAQGTAYHLGGSNWFEADEKTASQIFNRSQFTLSFALQRDFATTGTGSLMRIHGAWSVALTSKGELEFSMTSQAGTTYKVISAGAKLTDTALHNIDLSFDANAGQAAIYVDGKAVGQGAVGGSTRMMASWGFAVGNPFGSSARAKIGDIAFIDYAKSATQVAAAYPAPLSEGALAFRAPSLADMLFAPAAAPSDPFAAVKAPAASPSIVPLAGLADYSGLAVARA